MLSKANAKIELFGAVHSEAFVFSFTERPRRWFGLFCSTFCRSSICVDVSPQKLEKLPHQVVAPRY